MDTYANEAMLAEAAASERDRARKAEAINAELLDALGHAVNWGHGFEGTGTRPEWLTEAEEAIRKAQP